MERKTSIVANEHGESIVCFPSNYDDTKLFFAVNDNYDADEPITASLILTRDETLDLIVHLTEQVKYMMAHESWETAR
jgi:hypothetical protein